MTAIRLTRVTIVLRRARHDGRHALTTVHGRVNVTWTGAAPLPHIQAVVILRRQMRGSERGAEGNVETNILVSGRNDNS